MAQARPTLDNASSPYRDAVHYAGFWRRMVADVIDNVLLLPIMSALAPMQWPHPLSLAGFAQALEETVLAHPVRQLLALIFAVAYSIVFWVRYLGTPGKLLLRCRLVDAETQAPLTVGQSLLRNLGYLVSYATLGLGFLWIAWDKRKQGFHDKIAGSIVLFVPRSSATSSL